jgi:transcriptional regulator with XRE-family HTH domain
MVVKMSAFQSNLKQILKDKGLTQTQFADALGISKGTLSDWLSGRYYPRGKYLQAMCDYLGVTMGELVSEKRDTIKLDAEIVTLYNELSDEKKQEVIDYARYLLHKNK